MIDDCFTRKKAVKEFLEDVDPEIDYDVVEITDVYGPTKTDPTFQVNIFIAVENSFSHFIAFVWRF